MHHTRLTYVNYSKVFITVTALAYLVDAAVWALVVVCTCESYVGFWMRPRITVTNHLGSISGGKCLSGRF